MSAREQLLGRIRGALSDVPAGEDYEIPRGYRQVREQPEGTVERFCERVADYQAIVERVSADGVSSALTTALQRAGATRIGTPSGLPGHWLPAEAAMTIVSDAREAPLTVAALDALDAVVTGSVVGIAETGTIVLESGPLCGRRALSLVPDVHVCVVRAADVVDDVPAAIARLSPRRPLTWISGPSATSDIELDRVEGVHGPRTLHVIVVDS